MFWQTATKYVTPLENFSSAALAMAINHYPQPFLRALQAIPDENWKPDSGRPEIDFVNIKSVTADTQVYLPNEEGRDSGWLDLVVTMMDRHGQAAVAWVEVKIDAPITVRDPSGGRAPRDQFDVYLEHRAVRENTFLVVLAKREVPVTDKVTTITWDDIVAAGAVLRPATNVWTDLEEFLWTQRVVIPPVPAVDAEALIPTFESVDHTIEALWTEPPAQLHWGTRTGSGVRGALRWWNDAMLSGGPLFWGLRPGSTGWEWQVAVATGSPYYKVWVEPEELRDAAEMGQLPSDWDRSQEHYRGWLLVLSKTRPFVAGEPGADVANWFDTALQELHDADLLEPYHRELRAKQLAKMQQGVKSP
jgi:hypothetical protein